jgi:biopolymer transport protein ExbD
MATAKTFDVWFVAANTVYRAVPYNVVADWTQEGRLNAADKLRPAGQEVPWKTVGEFELFSDYLSRPPNVHTAPGSAPVEIPEAPEEETLITSRRPGEDDDEVDMIPLIDISMVLLVFFIMVSATGALSPVDVPDMRYGGELVSDPEAITISIEKANAEDVHYSVRTGQNPPKPDDSGLPNPEAALAALDAMLSERTRPPEVRIACEKDLPSERVIELSKELKKRLESRKINSFVATVNEAPKK